MKTDNYMSISALIKKIMFLSLLVADLRWKQCFLIALKQKATEKNPSKWAILLKNHYFKMFGVGSSKVHIFQEPSRWPAHHGSSMI